MKQIYQLTESEYKELVEAANLNKDLIDQKAKTLYEKYGNHSITLKIQLGESYDDKLVIKASGYVNDWESKYPISREEAKKIMTFVKSRAEELFYDRFESFIYKHDELSKAKRSFENRRKSFTQITVLGWAIALISLVVILFK